MPWDKVLVHSRCTTCAPALIIKTIFQINSCSVHVHWGLTSSQWQNRIVNASSLLKLAPFLIINAAKQSSPRATRDHLYVKQLKNLINLSLNCSHQVLMIIKFSNLATLNKWASIILTKLLTCLTIDYWISISLVLFLYRFEFACVELRFGLQSGAIICFKLSAME